MRTLVQLLTIMLLSTLASANPVRIGNTGITFEPPPGFTALSQEVIDRKWPSGRKPHYAVSNNSATTTVAYDLKPHTRPQDKLPEAQKSFTKLFDRLIPGIVWKRNAVVERAGQKWILMELTSNAIDTDVHNIVLVTGVTSGAVDGTAAYLMPR